MWITQILKLISTLYSNLPEGHNYQDLDFLVLFFHKKITLCQRIKWYVTHTYQIAALGYVSRTHQIAALEFVS